MEVKSLYLSRSVMHGSGLNAILSTKLGEGISQRFRKAVTRVGDFVVVAAVSLNYCLSEGV
jgi:hypothetical protein